MTHLINYIFKNRITKILFFSLIAFVLFLLSYDNVMFWDNVLFTSKMGNELYNNGIFNWHIPAEFDPGKPPILGFLLAITWKIFGHNLWSSHLLMIPFAVGLLFQLHLLIAYYFKDKRLQFFALLLLVADPTLSAQFFLVNPELIQVFFFFLAVNAILYNRYYLKTVALFFLSIISFRGMMLAGGVFVFEVLNRLLIQKKGFLSLFNFKFITSYLIGSSSAVVYLLWRIYSIGWIHTRPNSPYEKIWFAASENMFFRNVIILAHRYLDFGRIFIFLFILFSIIKFRKSFFSKEIKQLVLLAFSAGIFVIITSLSANNPMGHRYFLSSYLVLILLSFVAVNSFYKKKYFIYTFLIFGLITGNLWIYPREIAQGWDASLAHLPYHKLRKEALDFMNENKINIEETTTFFPNYSTVDNIDLSGDLRRFKAYNNNNKYVFYSNIYNLSDDTYKNLDTNYTIIKKFEKLRIHIYIYKLKEK